MIRTWLLLIFLFLTAQFSQAQVKKNQQLPVIVDPVENASFVLKRTKEYITLPDSLRGKAVKGFVVVRVSVTKYARHKLERVMKLSITDPGNFTLVYTSLDYSREMTHKVSNINIIPYYELISNYVKKDIYFIPANNNQLNQMTFIDFMIRFK